MKRFTVLLHPGAQQDVRDAYAWIVERSLDGAAKWHAGLVAFVKSLETLPKSHPVAAEDEELKDGIRSAPYIRPGSTYRILYTIESDCVHVIAVRHGRRNWIDADELQQLLDRLHDDTAGTEGV